MKPTRFSLVKEPKIGSKVIVATEWEGSEGWTCSKCGENNVPDNHKCV